jgi:hypothetical protein
MSFDRCIKLLCETVPRDIQSQWSFVLPTTDFIRWSTSLPVSPNGRARRLESDTKAMETLLGILRIVVLCNMFDSSLLFNIFKRRGLLSVLVLRQHSLDLTSALA